MLTAALPALALALAPSTSAHAGVDDGQGKEWRQITETRGATWTQLDQSCPRDGATPCAGPGGWVWATAPQVVALFQLYDPSVDANGNSTDVWSGFAANGFLSAFQPTFSFASTYQAGASASGWIASTDANGLPLVGSVGWSTNLASFSGGFGIGAAANPDSSSTYTGAFMWRPTGLADGLVYANDDAGSVASPAGGVAVANVLSNDWVAGAPATLANATLRADLASGLTLDAASGRVLVEAGAAAGVHTLTYELCALADPANCDTAEVTVTVPAYRIDAVNDAGTASPSTGGVAVASVLANDVLGTARATVSTTQVSLVSSAHAGVTLDPSDGSVDVAQGTPLGTYALVYRLCERANPTNCDTATAKITVARRVVYANDDSARASSKVANTAIASVFANDTIGGVRASAASVRLSLVTAPPAKVVLDSTTGAVRVTGKTESGLYRFIYRICELADLGNCDDAVVTLDLSGK
jgi:hypothetical protein